MHSFFAIAVNSHKLAVVALLAALQTGCAGTVIGTAADTVVEVAKVPGKLTDAAIAVVADVAGRAAVWQLNDCPELCRLSSASPRRLEPTTGPSADGVT